MTQEKTTSAARMRKMRANKTAEDASFAAKESKRIEAVRKRRVDSLSEEERENCRRRGAEHVHLCRMKKEQRDTHGQLLFYILNL